MVGGPLCSQLADSQHRLSMLLCHLRTAAWTHGKFRMHRQASGTHYDPNAIKCGTTQQVSTLPQRRGHAIPSASHGFACSKLIGNLAGCEYSVDRYDVIPPPSTVAQAGRQEGRLFAGPDTPMMAHSRAQHMQTPDDVQSVWLACSPVV